MPNYKKMYTLVMRQSNKALRLVRAAQQQMRQAAKLLEDSHLDAEHIYIESGDTIPFVHAQPGKKPKKDETE